MDTTACHITLVDTTAVYLIALPLGDSSDLILLTHDTLLLTPANNTRWISWAYEVVPVHGCGRDTLGLMSGRIIELSTTYTP